LTKYYDSNHSLNQKIMNGVNILADNVASTLGPRGRNVILQKKGDNPIITKDGVTIAKFIELEDPFENSAAQIIKQAAAKSNAEAGDGTTTTTVLARAILEQSQRYLIAGTSPVEIKRGMDKAASDLVAELKNMAIPIKSESEMQHIATISANGDRVLGELVSMAVDRAGRDGGVQIEDARSVDTSVDLVEGFIFNSGYFSPSFVTNESKGTVEYDDVFVLVTDEKLDQVQQILPTLEAVSKDGRPLLIVASEVEGQALAALVLNAVRGTMKVAAIKAPGYGKARQKTLEDLAVSLGATYISRSKGLKVSDAKLENLGLAKRYVGDKYNSTFVGGKGKQEDINSRIDSLRSEFAITDSIHECERIQERITRLSSGIAVIRVGAATEIEMIEKKHRIEDALEAVQSAQAEGVVPGGGVALLRAAQMIETSVSNKEQQIGVDILKRACLAPIMTMARNAGESADVIVNMVSDAAGSTGYDFHRRELIDLQDSGVIDPVKVTRCALINSVSVASTLITTNFGVIEK
jgi:chaperonin GroEL